MSPDHLCAEILRSAPLAWAPLVMSELVIELAVELALSESVRASERVRVELAAKLMEQSSRHCS